MTNREWLNSLSNEDFVKWLLDGEIWNGSQFEEPYPKLETLKYQATQADKHLIEWLKQEKG